MQVFSSKPQEEEHLPDDMESDKTELTERLETLERTVSDVSNTVSSLQKSLETLRKKVGPMSGGIQDFSKGLTFVRGGGGVTTHCLINKICELGSLLLKFFLCVSSNGGD